MSSADLLHLNLTSPAVLAFALGLLATRVKGDLRFPEQITGLISTYLLFAIGFKGGLQLRNADIEDVWKPVIATLILGLIVPVVTFIFASRVLRFTRIDSAALAAHFGSVSAVTFTAAEAFAKAAGNLEEQFLPALVAILEIPGIVVALVIASRGLQTTSIKTAIHEVLTGKSILLLGGGLMIGLVSSLQATELTKPFFVELFPGVLVLFLLDLGGVAGRQFAEIRSAGARLVVLGILSPLVFGTMGVFIGTQAGLSIGGATVFAAMAASASYIAAPAAVRVGLPNANLGLCLGASIGITFPFNLIIGIPLFSEIAQRIA